MSNPEKFFITIERELFAEDLDVVVKEIQKDMKNGPNFLEHSSYKINGEKVNISKYNGIY